MFKKINNAYTYDFLVDQAGLYSVSILAICQKKNYLRVEIDGLALKGVLPKKKNEYFNVPPAWNGNELRGVSRIVVLILKLSQGKHNLKFVSKREAEMVSAPEVALLDKDGLLTLFKDLKSEERNCQPWITVALIDLPLSILDISVSCGKKFLDSDDAMLIIDGKIQKNKQSILRGKNWFWRGRQLKGKTQTDRFYLNLPSGTHYIELWADRTPKLHSLELTVGDGGIDEDGNVNKNQVGNYGDSSLDVLNGRGVMKEYELKNGEILEINYHGKALVVDVYSSIYWGIRWLYHKAQWIDSKKVRHWYSWKEAVARYGPPVEEYAKNVWDIYTLGIKREKTGIIRLWPMALLILLFFFLGKSHFCSSVEAKISDKVVKEQNQKIVGVDIEYSKDRKYFLAQSEREKDWWEDLKFGKIDNKNFNWLLIDKPPGEQAILSAKFIDSKEFANPLVEVYGLTHAGHGHLYIYEIKDNALKLLFEEPAVDYNPDIRWSPDNFKKYGYGQCGEAIRGGRLSHSFKDVNDDEVPEIILSGVEDVICEKISDEKIEEIKVASNPVYKIFYLPQSIALNANSF